MYNIQDDELKEIVGGTDAKAYSCKRFDCIFYEKDCPNNHIIVDKGYGDICLEGVFRTNEIIK